MRFSRLPLITAPVTPSRSRMPGACLGSSPVRSMVLPSMVTPLVFHSAIPCRLASRKVLFEITASVKGALSEPWNHMPRIDLPSACSNLLPVTTTRAFGSGWPLFDHRARKSAWSPTGVWPHRHGWASCSQLPSMVRSLTWAPTIAVVRISWMSFLRRVTLLDLLTRIPRWKRATSLSDRVTSCEPWIQTPRPVGRPITLPVLSPSVAVSATPVTAPPPMIFSPDRVTSRAPSIETTQENEADRASGV